MPWNVVDVTRLPRVWCFALMSYGGACNPGAHHTRGQAPACALSHTCWVWPAVPTLLHARLCWTWGDSRRHASSGSLRGSSCGRLRCVRARPGCMQRSAAHLHHHAPGMHACCLPATMELLGHLACMHVSMRSGGALPAHVRAWATHAHSGAQRLSARAHGHGDEGRRAVAVHSCAGCRCLRGHGRGH